MNNAQCSNAKYGTPPLQLVLAANAFLRFRKELHTSLLVFHCRNVYANQRPHLSQPCIDDHVARLLLIDDMQATLDKWI